MQWAEESKSYLYLKQIDNCLCTCLPLITYLYLRNKTEHYHFVSSTIKFDTGDIYKYDDKANYNRYIKAEISSKWDCLLTSERLEDELFKSIPKVVPKGAILGDMASGFDYKKQKIVVYLAVKE